MPMMKLPLPGLLRVRRKVSLVSTVESSATGMVMVLLVSPALKVRVPVVVVKSLPAVALIPVVA